MAWEHIRPHGDVFVGIPHRGQVSTAWAINMLHALSSYLSRIKLFTIQGHPIDVSRNVLVERASGAEYIYFLDSDVYTEPNTLQRLRHHELPIVTALYEKGAQDPCTEQRAHA